MAGHAKPGSRVQVDELRVAMALLGADVESIASEVGRRYGYRPRQAWRMALGWDQVEAAARYNAVIQSRGPEHDGRDTMTPSRISEYERWPGTTRRPSPYVLGTLAELYETAVARLLEGSQQQQRGLELRRGMMFSSALRGIATLCRREYRPLTERVLIGPTRCCPGYVTTLSQFLDPR